jgi:putative transposase
VNDDVKQHSDEVALFRFGVIGDLVHLAPGTKGLYARLQEKAAIDYRIPGSLRTRVAEETIRGWLRRYRKGELDALRPRVRADHGTSHALPREVSDLLVSIKDEKPDLSVQLVIREALASGKVPAGLTLAPSTVHRLLSRSGLMAKKPAEPSSKDHRRFSFEKAGDLWMSDVMHGPAVTVTGKKRKAYLIAFIDDATRVIPYAAFALSENTAAFLPVLKEAVLRRGVCRRLFVDNGSAFRSHQLALVCAKLGITLIHARAYHAQAKGKIERWFRTVRMQLLPLLKPFDLQSLDALNRRLWAFVEGEYHRTPHRGLDGATPLDRWAALADEVRFLGPDLDDLFLHEAKRKVAKDRTVSLNGVAYEVDAALVDETVVLRYDPAKPGRAVQVWAKGALVQEAKVVDVHGNCFVKREKPQGLRLADLDEKPALSLSKGED